MFVMVRRAALFAALLAASTGALAEDKVLNIYSSRHYPSDEALFAGYTRLTGIKVNLIEANENALIERLRNEGTRSPADVLITTDAGRLWHAQQAGLLQPVKSAALEARVPANLREPGGHWFGFAMRARVIAYNKAKVKPAEVPTYESLADPRWKGRICVRSGTHIYNLSLMAALIERLGEQRAEQWAKAVKANLARDPKGGDTDQIKGVAAGECDVALTNHYYYARLARSAKPDERAVAERVGLAFPNQSAGGTHVNISGAAVARHAPHRQAAIGFLEYLASEDAQRHFADENNEWPVAPGAMPVNPVLAALGGFERERLNVGVLGRNQASAQKIYDRAGWK